jgi:hypothetical protein
MLGNTGASITAAAAAVVDASGELSEDDDELEHGCVYVDQGWQSSADAPVMSNPLFLLGSPISSP